MITKLKISILSTIVLLCFNTLNAQVLTSSEIDQLLDRTLKTFDVPGIAVAVVKDGKIIHAKGYGVRSLNTKLKVDENTLFRIASNSKAFTVAALGILVDEGKLKWDDQVIDYVPEFRLYDPYVTNAFTIRDLLTHRSGLGLGAGDLMIFPDSSNFTVNDIIHNLRYLKSVSEFRTKFDYDNLLYIVAGEVIARVLGISWEDFIENRIMKPLKMTQSAANYNRLKDKSNVIDAHAPVNGTVQVIKRDFSTTADAAGGIYSNLTDLSKWIIMQMNDGKYGENTEQHLFSERVHDEMWTPQTIIPINERLRGQTSKIYNTHFGAYGLGWFLNDAKGYKQVSHSGGLAGIVTLVTLIPELKLGIIVLTNQQSGAAFSAVTNTIKDGYLGIKGNDWVKILKDASTESQKNADKITSEVNQMIDASLKSSVPVKNDLFTGTYSDKWFGDVTITEQSSKLYLASVRSPRLTGELLPYKGNTFIVKWNDRSFDADAYVKFTTDTDGKATGIKMEAISPLTDFSYDFQDLDFSRKAEVKKDK
jgi:CubicO group peptidase (beta-lactamase class C family)